MNFEKDQCINTLNNLVSLEAQNTLQMALANSHSSESTLPFFIIIITFIILIIFIFLLPLFITKKMSQNSKLDERPLKKLGCEHVKPYHPLGKFSSRQTENIVLIFF